MARKPRSDSASAAIKAMVDAASPLPEPPPHVALRDEHRPFWLGIVRARARDEWSTSDLVLAAQLARCQFDIESETSALDAEGSVIENARGSSVMNPRVTILERLAARELAYMRALRMCGMPAGDPRDIQKARKIQRHAEEAREELADQDLLAS